MKTTAQVLKKEGQQIALFNAGNEWALCAIYELRRYLMDQRRNYAAKHITFDHFRHWNEQQGQLFDPRSQNAWGALPRLAVREGLIKPTDRTAPARRKQSHGRLVRVWEIVA